MSIIEDSKRKGDYNMKIFNCDVGACFREVFRETDIRRSLMENLLIWTYDEAETDKKYLDRIYYSSGVIGCSLYVFNTEELALINFLLIFKYRKIVKKLLKSNRSDEFKAKIPRHMPEEYNIYNFGDMLWMDKFYEGHMKCYDEKFMRAYIGD